jgi:hypothetical protein
MRTKAMAGVSAFVDKVDGMGMTYYKVGFNIGFKVLFHISCYRLERIMSVFQCEQRPWPERAPL